MLGPGENHFKEGRTLIKNTQILLKNQDVATARRFLSKFSRIVEVYELAINFTK